ncbi:MAG: hypothetical protein KC800_13310, partial [Candidatus Eremiobacteraeota bacterium]|nr:hypothetical protein [Candidatus Eremiobacteraeota bacterium]
RVSYEEQSLTVSAIVDIVSVLQAAVPAVMFAFADSRHEAEFIVENHDLQGIRPQIHRVGGPGEGLEPSLAEEKLRSQKSKGHPQEKKCEPPEELHFVLP